MSKLIWIGLAVAGLAGAAGWEWYRHQDLRLAEAPARVEATPTRQPVESALSVALEIPYAAMMAAAEAALPTSQPVSGNGPRQCIKLFVEICSGTEYKGTISRGSIAIAAAGGALTVTTELTVDGTVGLTGKLAERFSATAKRVHGKAKVSGRLSVSVRDDWCAAVAADVRHEWIDNPTIELARDDIFGSLTVDVSGVVDGEIARQLPALQQAIAQAVPCDRIKAEVAKVWRRYSLPVGPVALASGQQLPLLQVRIDPTGAGVSPAVFDSDRVRLSVALAAAIDVAAAPGPTDAKSGLPPFLTGIDGRRTRLEVPVTIGFDQLRTLLRGLAAKPVAFDVAGRPGSVTIRDLALYATGAADAPALALEMDLTASLPGQIFDTSGRLYLVGRPVLDGSILRLEGFGIRRRLDNPLSEAVVTALEASIVRQVTAAARLDLAPHQAALADGLQTALAQVSGPVRFTADKPEIAVADVAVGSAGVTVVMRATMSLGATVAR